MDRYHGKRPFIRGDFHWSNGSYSYDSSHASLTDFNKAREIFDQYYGINCSTKNSNQLALDYKCSRTWIQRRINFIAELLKQMHKKDIWYNTLP